MQSPVIAIIGAGHMGSSLISGLIKTSHPNTSLWVTDPDDNKLTHLQKTFKVHTTTDNKKAVETADIVIFAVKPQIFSHVATDLEKIIHKHKPLIISIAAGIRTVSIQQWLGGNLPIVRAMPNTPALVGCGATALYATTNVTPEQRELAESILSGISLVVWLSEEKLMDAVTALSGSGPAYFFLMMESLQQAAVQLGLPPETARILTLQTALGAARMAMESDKPLAELRQHVTSPGGTTEKAISVLEENNIRGLFKNALHAAKSRSEELANIHGEKK